MGVLSADFDDDGLLDLWFSNIGRRHLLRRDPTPATFVEDSDTFGLGLARAAGVTCLGPEPRECLNSSWSAVRFDFDGDGWHDHVIATAASPSLAVRRTGPRERARRVAVGCQDVRALVADDFDGDGRPDLFATAIGGHDRLLRNVSDGRRPGRLVRVVGRAPNTGAIGSTGFIHRASGLAEPFLVGEGGSVLSFWSRPCTSSPDR